MSEAVFHALVGFCRIHICFYLHNLAVGFSFTEPNVTLFQKGQKRLFFKMSQYAFAWFVSIAAVQSPSSYLILALRLLQTPEPLLYQLCCRKKRRSEVCY